MNAIREIMKRTAQPGPHERAPDAWFERTRIGVRPKRPDISGDSFICFANAPRYTCDRSEHFEFSPSDMPALSLDLGPMSLMSVTGRDVDTYSFDLHAEVACDDRQQAAALLQRLSFRREGGTFVLKTPPNLPHVQCLSFLDVLTPVDRAVVVTGTYSAVQVFGVLAPVTVSTTHARISLFDIVGHIDAIANEGGSIVFTGKRGQARLNADLGIDVKITDQRYDGTIEATANGPVRVQLPPGFVTGFEANVQNNAQFICRAGIQSQLTRKKEAGRVAVTCGSSGESRLRFVSRREVVVIDAVTQRND